VAVKFVLANTAIAKQRCDVLAVTASSGTKLSSAAAAIDGLLDGALSRNATAHSFTGKLGETLLVAASGIGAKSVLLVGTGAVSEVTADSLRRVGAAIAKQSRKARSTAVAIVDAIPSALDAADGLAAVAEGIVLGNYQFLKYKSDPKRSTLANVVLVGASGSRIQTAVDGAVIAANATCWARDMINEPAEAKSPADMVTAATKLLRGKSVKIEAWQGPELTRRKLNGTIVVGQGSRRTPRFLRLEYAPRDARHTLALIGKGVVFDSGGLSLKPSSGMEQMKTDMSGAAAVIATMSVLAELGVRSRVVGYVPLVENMIGGNAYRLGDVITYRNGKTVEVMNTDAEGRLILADALVLASDEAPDAMINLATLTGACMVALGPKVAGVMGNNDPWIEQVKAASQRSGEPLWQLPLPAEYRKMLDSEIADMKNVGGSYGGAITAGLFLKEFVGKVPWAHLDIAGPSRAESDDAYLCRGGTGFGVRTLIELVQTFRKPR
jgi:leucyl aminopeptidase